MVKMTRFVNLHCHRAGSFWILWTLHQSLEDFGWWSDDNEPEIGVSQKKQGRTRGADDDAGEIRQESWNDGPMVV